MGNLHDTNLALAEEIARLDQENQKLVDRVEELTQALSAALAEPNREELGALLTKPL